MRDKMGDELWWTHDLHSSYDQGLDVLSERMEMSSRLVKRDSSFKEVHKRGSPIYVHSTTATLRHSTYATL
jgi:hypothetical protein